MSNIIGVHAMANPDRNGFDPFLDKLKPALCVCLVTLDQWQYVRGLAQTFPAIKFVAAPWFVDLGTRDNFGPFQEAATQREAGQVYFNPDIAWNNWLNLDGGKMRAFHEGLRGLPNVYIQGHNEVGVFEQYVTWEKQRTAQTRDLFDLKSVVINDGVGKGQFAHFQLYQSMGLYNVLHDWGGVLGRHDYAGGFLELWHGEAQAISTQAATVYALGESENVVQLHEWDNLTLGDEKQVILWQGGKPFVMAQSESWPLAKHPTEYMNKMEVYEAARFNPTSGDLSSWLALRVLREHHWINITGGGNIPIMITEYGYDDAGRQSLAPYYSNTYGPRGIVNTRKIWDEWNLINHETILGKQLAYADAQLRKVPMVQGASLFQYGERNSEAWKLFNFESIDFVDAYLAALNPTEPPPPDDEPPASGCIPLASRVFSALTGGQVR